MLLRMHLWLLVGTLTSSGAILQPNVAADFCLQAGADVFNASCPHGHIVVMTHARYGRMRLGKCLKRDYYIGCATDVMAFADDRCSGRQRCSIGSKDDIANLHSRQPCPSDLMSYLSVSYSCVKVTEQRSCLSQSRTMTSQSGVIASSVAKYRSCSWTIRLEPGQKINLTVVDFSLEQMTHRKNNFCNVYATVKEKGQKNDVTVCGGAKRTQHILTSKSNEISLKIMSINSEPAPPRFIFIYSTIGCPDIPRTRSRWTRRIGDKVTIHCNRTKHTWHLVCRENKWVGKYNNCSEPVLSASSHASLGLSREIPYGIVIAIGAGVVLGVSLGFLMLCIAIKIQSRSRPQHVSKLNAADVYDKRVPAPPPRPSLVNSSAEARALADTRVSRCYNTTAITNVANDREVLCPVGSMLPPPPPHADQIYHELNSDVLQRLTAELKA